MKQIKKFLTVLTALVFFMIPLCGNTLTAQAEEGPITYYVRYIPSTNEWVFQTGGWSDTAAHRHLYYMQQEIKDGSLLVIDDAGAGTGINLTVNVSLSNLTIASSNLSNITAKHVDNFYSIGASKSIINATISNAYVYDYSLVNFNNDVNNLEVISSNGDDLHATIGASAAVAHLKAYTPARVYYDFYDFKKDTLRIDDGTLKTEEAHYSKVPVAAPAPEVPAAPSTPAAPSDSSSGEYDDVPKTADIRFNPLWLVVLAGICFAGSYTLKKEK